MWFDKNNKEKQCTQLATAVRDTQYASAPTMELAFNPATGQFEQVPAGSASSGEIVTEMTKDGFAARKDRVYITKEDLHSRSHSLLETDILSKKHVVIIGLGSFGSQIAVELAKAGVGRFSLIDFDIVELHNLGRHIAYLKDVGELKTDVVGEAILGKNPFAKIQKYAVDISDEPIAADAAMTTADLVICATDNNRSRFVVSEIARRNGKPVIFGRAFTRAEGGDVFIYRPGGPCYNCLVGAMGSATEEITDREKSLANGTIPAYTSPEDADAMVQVGLSVDIAPICNLMEKLALVELSRGLDSGISSLEDEFVYEYYIWANRRDRKFSNWAAMPGAGANPTIMRWYGSHIGKVEGCPICSDNVKVALDEGEEVEEMLNKL